MDSQTNTTETTPQLSPSEHVKVHPKRKLNWKGFFIGIVIVIIIEIFAVNALTKENKHITPTHPTPDRLNEPTTPPTVPTVDTANWKTYTDSSWSSNLTVKYPATFSLDENLAGFTLANSKTDFESYLQTAPDFNNPNAIIITGTVSDLQFDTQTPSDKHTLWEFIQKDMNMEFSKGRLVDGSTQVPWQNENGGTSTGQKYYLDNVPYEHIKIQGRDSARIKWKNVYVYYIPSASGKSYATFSVQPINSSLIKIFTSILDTYSVTENKPPYTEK